MLNFSNDNSTSTEIGNILKLVSIILILAITLLFGYYPLLFKLSKKSTRFLSFFNSFSGGVFIVIGLFLLLPQSKEVLENWTKGNIQDEKLKDLPFCFFISFGAYSIMLLIEKVVFSSQSLIPMVHGEAGHTHGHSNEIKHEVSPHRESEVSSHSQAEEADEDEDEEAFKNVVSAKGKFASFLGMRNSKI